VTSTPQSTLLARLVMIKAICRILSSWKNSASPFIHRNYQLLENKRMRYLCQVFCLGIVNDDLASDVSGGCWACQE